MCPSRGGRGEKALHDGHYRDRSGFPGVGPLSELGRNFTMVLLAAGITGIGVWFALIASFIVEFDDGLLEAKEAY